MNHDGTAAPTPFDAFVYSWDGTKATGPQLFGSGPLPFVATGTGSVPFTVNTGSVALTGGSQYVAFFSASNRFDGVDDSGNAFDYVPNNPYTGGAFVFDQNGNNFNALTTTAWDGANAGLGDLRFSASFSATTIPAPEPSTWAMMLIGFATLAFATRRKRLA